MSMYRWRRAISGGGRWRCFPNRLPVRHIGESERRSDADIVGSERGPVPVLAGAGPLRLALSNVLIRMARWDRIQSGTTQGKTERCMRRRLRQVGGPCRRENRAALIWAAGRVPRRAECPPAGRVPPTEPWGRAFGSPKRPALATLSASAHSRWPTMVPLRPRRFIHRTVHALGRMHK